MALALAIGLTPPPACVFTAEDAKVFAEDAKFADDLYDAYTQQTATRQLPNS